MRALLANPPSHTHTLTRQHTHHRSQLIQSHLLPQYNCEWVQGDSSCFLLQTYCIVDGAHSVLARAFTLYKGQTPTEAMEGQGLGSALCLVYISVAVKTPPYPLPHSNRVFAPIHIKLAAFTNEMTCDYVRSIQLYFCTLQGSWRGGGSRRVRRV